MSVLSCITVHQCDHCKKIAVLNSDRQYQEFTDTWWTSCNLDYCPVCRNLDHPAILAAVAEELALQRTMKRVIRKYGVEAYKHAG
jgi:hypothetical protein